MRSSVGRAIAAAAGLVLLLAPSASAGWWDGGYGSSHEGHRNAPPNEQPLYGCENRALPGTKPLLHKETTPPPGTPVQPGDAIVVEITWRLTDWVAPDLHKALDCVSIDNRYVPELSGGERPTPNDGHFSWRYVVPAGLPAGATICDQGFVSGPTGEEEYGREISNVVCFPVGAAPAPPATTTTSTTTTTEQPPQGERLAQQRPLNEAPAATQRPQPQEVLPRTGGGAGGARLAAQALGLSLLSGAVIRRRRPRRTP